MGTAVAPARGRPGDNAPPSTIGLNGPRMRRLARSTALVEQLKAWQAREKQHDLDPDVRENASDSE